MLLPRIRRIKKYRTKTKKNNKISVFNKKLESRLLSVEIKSCQGSRHPRRPQARRPTSSPFRQCLFTSIHLISITIASTSRIARQNHDNCCFRNGVGWSDAIQGGIRIGNLGMLCQMPSTELRALSLPAIRFYVVCPAGNSTTMVVTLWRCLEKSPAMALKDNHLA